ncbi:MAG: NADH-quinone oxidoreductase subunit D [Acidobacteria bacterium]|nr:NADH-quinone oxidoreductase subunit D [Acidobacteriota bacterium]
MAEETTILESSEMILNMGPQHPSTHGVLRVKLKLDGEKVLDAECIIGYLHRGMEKIGENRTYPKYAPYLDRMDYVAAVTNNLAFLEAVEKLLGLECPPRAKYARTMLAEFQRIASHLLWLATHALDIGAMTIFLYCFREREEILKLFEEIFGARLTCNAFRVGGLTEDLPAGWLEQAKAFTDIFPSRVDDYEGILTENRIWLQRTKEVGVISAANAIDIGLTGPALRASGVKWDIRKAMPYESYADMDFEVPVGTRGDTYDRYLVRMQEMRQANRIIRQCVEGLPGGDFKAKTPRVIKPPLGEVYHSIEGPKGEIGYYIVSDGSTIPYRVRVRPPSFMNLQALAQLARGHYVADVVALIGTLDIVLGEIDR